MKHILLIFFAAVLFAAAPAFGQDNSAAGAATPASSSFPWGLVGVVGLVGLLGARKRAS